MQNSINVNAQYIFGQSNLDTLPIWQSGKLYLKIKNTSSIDLLSFPNYQSSVPSSLISIFAQYEVEKIEKPFVGFNTANFDRTYRISFTQFNEIENFISDLIGQNYIEYAEKIPAMYTFTVPDDPIQCYYLGLINADGASNIHQTSPGASGNTVVAIVDDAVMTNHEDLVGNISTTNRDVADGDNDPMPPFTNDGIWFGHGTAVASIAGAVTNNTKGIASVGWSNTLECIKTVRDGGDPGIIEFGYDGVYWAATQGDAKVINMSWGGPGFSSTDYNVIVQAKSLGVVLIAAAGNNFNQFPHYPAAYGEGISGTSWEILDRKLVIAVSGLDNNNNNSLWGFSNNIALGSSYGQWVDISSYGYNVDCAMKNGISGTPILNSYINMTGTSGAAPIVSGVAGLMRSYNSAATANDVYDCLISSANPDIYTNHPLNINNTLGYGRLDAQAALSCINVNCNHPIATISSSAPLLCPGSNVTLMANNGGTAYQWSGGGNTQSKIVNSTGTYSVTVTFQGGCTASASFQLASANTQAQILINEGSGNAANDGILCGQDMALVNAYYGSGYSWSFGGSNPFAAIPNPGGPYPVTISYSVTVTGAGGCPGITSTASVSFTWNAPPGQVNITPLSTTAFCTGGSVQLQVPSGFTHYQWYNGTLIIIGAISSTYTANSSGIYKCLVTNNNGCTGFSNDQAVDVYPVPTVTITSSTGSYTMCAGPTHLLVANVNPGNGAYITENKWYRNIGGGTGQLVLSGSNSYAPTQTGDYKFFIRNSYGCSYTSSWIHVIITSPPTVSIAAPSSQCAGAQLCTTSGFVSYAWAPSNVSTPCVNAINATIYTVTVTDASGCTNTSTYDFTNLNTSCCANYVSTIDQNNFSTTQHITQSSNLHTPVLIPNGAIITIDNSINIAVSSGNTITVEYGGTLNVDHAHLFACGDMWGGIIVEPGGILKINGSTIEDATTAIFADGGGSVGGQLSISNSIFNHNFEGVDLINGDFSNSTITSTHFKCVGPIQRSPHIGVVSVTHISLSLVGPLFQIGDASAPSKANYFSNAETAIDATRSMISVLNNYFHMTSIGINIRGWFDLADIPIIGDDSQYGYNIFWGYSNEAINAINVNAISIHNNIIYDCYTGIHCFNANTSDISNNDISNYSLYGPPYFPQTIGIDIEGTGTERNTVISNNTISYAATGIHVNSTPNAHIGNLNRIYTYVTNDDAANSNSIQRGILVQNCSNAYIGANQVWHSWNDLPANNALPWTRGIDAELTLGGLIWNNHIERTGSGLRFVGDCTASQLQCNVMTDCYNGVYLDNSTQTDQGSSSNASDNYWIDQGGSAGDRIDGINQINQFRWYYNDLNPMDNNYNPNPHLPTYINDVNNATHQDCPDPNAPLIDIESELEDIANNSYEYDDYQDEMEYINNQFLYERLRDDSLLMYNGGPTDSIFQLIYNQLRNGNIGLFSDVKELIRTHDFATAFILNSQIADENLMEANKKAVNEIFLSCRLNDTIPDSTEQSTLESIAYQNPLSGGEGVYIARSILGLHIEDNFPLLRKKHKSKLNVNIFVGSLFPVPATNSLTYQLDKPLPNLGNLELEIKDLVGKTILVHKVKDNLRISVNTENIQTGLYLFRFLINNVEIDHGKVIIAK